MGTTAALTQGKDWVSPYYLDIGVVLTLGMTPHDLMLAVFARATNPNSGGRQMPTHWSQKELRDCLRVQSGGHAYSHRGGAGLGVAVTGGRRRLRGVSGREIHVAG